MLRFSKHITFVKVKKSNMASNRRKQNPLVIKIRCDKMCYDN